MKRTKPRKSKKITKDTRKFNEAPADVTSSSGTFSDYEVSEVTAKQADTVEVSMEGAKKV